MKGRKKPQGKKFLQVSRCQMAICSRAYLCTAPQVFLMLFGKNDPKNRNSQTFNSWRKDRRTERCEKAYENMRFGDMTAFIKYKMRRSFRRRERALCQRRAEAQSGFFWLEATLPLFILVNAFIQRFYKDAVLYTLTKQRLLWH